MHHDQVTLAHEFRLARPQRHLVFWTALAALAVLAAAVADFYAVLLFMRESFLDETGHETVPGMVVASVAVMTLALYWLAGESWNKGEARKGNLFYTGAVALLVAAMWDWDKQWSNKIWVDAFPAWADGPPPFLFLLPFNIGLGLIFSACGLLFIRFERILVDRIEDWRVHHCATKMLRQDELARAADSDVEKLAGWLEYVEGNVPALGRHLYRVAFDQETSAVAMRLDELRSKAGKITTTRTAKIAALAEAERLDAWLKACAAVNDDGKENGEPPADAVRRGGKPPTATPIDQSAKRRTGAAIMAALLCVTGLYAVPVRAQAPPANGPNVAAISAAPDDSVEELFQALEREEQAKADRLVMYWWCTGLLEGAGSVLLVFAWRRWKAARQRRAAVLAALLCYFGLAGPLPLAAQSTVQQCEAAAPSFVLMIDVSNSSPAQHPAFIKQAASEVEAMIRDHTSMCSKVVAFTVGDGRSLPLMFSARIYNRRVPGKGDTKDGVIRAVRQFLARMPAEIKERPQGRSELIGAWEDAARNFNPDAKTPNFGMMISDGVEESSYARCEKRECQFPKPKFKLTGAHVSLLGIGQGLPSDRAASLARTWQTWFAQTGINVKAFRIVKVF